MDDPPVKPFSNSSFFQKMILHELELGQSGNHSPGLRLAATYRGVLRQDGGQRGLDIPLRNRRQIGLMFSTRVVLDPMRNLSD